MIASNHLFVRRRRASQNQNTDTFYVCVLCSYYYSLTSLCFKRGSVSTSKHVFLLQQTTGPYFSASPSSADQPALSTSSPLGTLAPFFCCEQRTNIYLLDVSETEMLLTSVFQNRRSRIAIIWNFRQKALAFEPFMAFIDRNLATTCRGNADLPALAESFVRAILFARRVGPNTFRFIVGTK